MTKIFQVKLIFILWIFLFPFSSFAPFKRASFQEFMMLIVDKKQALAKLLTLPSFKEKSKKIATFHITTGKVGGDKQKQNDLRTPEGIYFPLKHISTHHLPFKKYGPLAIPLNFPNPMDREKTGYGIWLHGAGDDRRITTSKNGTEGCVAFFNRDIIQLKNWIKPLQGVIVIGKNSHMINRAEDIQVLYKLTTAWIKSWQSRKISKYIHFYHPEFRHRYGHTPTKYKKYKKKIFSLYKTMTINMTFLRILTHPKYAISFMNQHFQGDQYSIYGAKFLYWKKDDAGRWKIIVEYFSRTPLKKLNYTVDKIALILKNQENSSRSL